MATVEYDVFLSHAWADGERPQKIADALIKAGYVRGSMRVRSRTSPASPVR